MLPLALRVQEKLERLVDKHMRSIGASKLSLSSLTTEALWQRSGRLQGDTSELLRLKSRAKDSFLLSPTHEEEITSLAAEAVRSVKDVPLRLYQVSRKYRDERRPRQGLLRAREFLMKDLYTFDADEATALQTYEMVKETYNAIFEELKVPYIVVSADSGAMGGHFSHEFHFLTPNGEDTIFSCRNCSYIANEELVEAHRPIENIKRESTTNSWTGLSRNGKGLVTVFYNAETSIKPSNTQGNISPYALKALVPDLDTSVEEPLKTWISNIEKATPESGLDFTVQTISDVNAASDQASLSPEILFQELLVSRVGAINMARDDQRQAPVTVESSRLSATVDLVRVTDGDVCPKCKTGSLRAQRAVELAHTFHLGTRYSEPLGAKVHGSDGQALPLVMGCHGIGMSRMMAALAAVLRDDNGLNWPSVAAPFEAIIIPGRKATEKDAQQVYDMLSLPQGRAVDVALDDRDSTMIQKLKDADLIGYPVIVLLGKAWTEERKCEVQCRRKGVRKNVELSELAEYVTDLIRQL